VDRFHGRGVQEERRILKSQRVCSCKTVVYRASLASPAFLPPRSLVAVASVDPSPPMPVPIPLPFFFASHDGGVQRQDTLSQSGRGVSKRQTAFESGSDQASLDSLSPSDRITSQEGSGGTERRRGPPETRTEGPNRSSFSLSFVGHWTSILCCWSFWPSLVPTASRQPGS
jgi:hypothetical protein